MNGADRVVEPSTISAGEAASAANAETLQGPAPLLRAGVALCVDLDGTLVKSDTLLDTVLVVARQRPVELVHIPGWIAQGRAAFKRHLTKLVALDVESLPYNRPLLEYLREQYGEGREIYLATAADRELAERIAAYLGIFAGVLASDGALNLAGGNKLAAFRAKFGDNFCYIGNARPDVELLAACVSPMVANPDRALLAGMKRSGTVAAARFDDRGPVLRSWLKAIRLHQWAKNALLFVPLLLAHQWHLRTFGGAITAFFSFGMCASATYIINDLLDLEADRRHPRKRRRPFAAGDLSAIAGVVVVGLLMLGALVLALALPHVFNALPGTAVLASPYSFLGWLALYTAVTLSYSLYLKRKLLLDVFVLSGLYTVRIMAGSAATGIPMSPWLAGFGVFFFLSLAFVKRFSELEGLRERGGSVSNGRGYFVSDLEQLRALGTGAMYAAVVVLSIYINNPETNFLYAHPVRLWVVVPVLLLWLSQVWMLASRGEMHDDPVVFAITDKRSLLLGVLMAAVILWAL
ncbi:UbiA family prenyltransferase [Granulicella sp. L46]|uniref:UbiA family prenyltransferase n=1 Tax=Granulicella sp. L46 TaxID=1641865 RepID=UPI00131E5736|nr:UbiA family prenyltransferase [Granulicella sp. L46]